MLQGTTVVFSASSDECVPEAVSQLAGCVVTKLAFFGQGLLWFSSSRYRERDQSHFQERSSFSVFSCTLLVSWAIIS